MQAGNLRMKTLSELHISARKRLITKKDIIKCKFGFHKWGHYGRIPKLKRSCVYCHRIEKGKYQPLWGNTKWVHVYNEKEGDFYDET